MIIKSNVIGLHVNDNFFFFLRRNANDNCVNHIYIFIIQSLNNRIRVPLKLVYNMYCISGKLVDKNVKNQEFTLITDAIFYW